MPLTCINDVCIFHIQSDGTFQFTDEDTRTWFENTNINFLENFTDVTRDHLEKNWNEWVTNNDFSKSFRQTCHWGGPQPSSIHVEYVDILINHHQKTGTDDTHIFVGLCIDLTERMKATILTKTIWLSHISHEIRTPLNSILGMTALLNDTKLDQIQKGYITKLASSSMEILSLINDVLDFSKLESGEISLKEQEFSLLHLVQSCIQIVSDKAKEKNNLIIYELGEDTDHIYKADVLRLQQIILNMLNNAIKFTNNGIIKLDVKSQPNSDSVLFCLLDSGMGMSSEEQESLVLVQDFTNLDLSHPSHPHRGMGFGLGICKRLCMLMGGRMWLASSELGKGSKFCFEIPLKLSMGEFLHAAKKSCLVIDSDEQDKMKICKLLLSWNLVPTPCSSPREAEMFMETGLKFDFCILSLASSDEYTSGVKCLRTLYKEIKIICLVPGHVPDSQPKTTVVNGIDNVAVLVKPLVNRELQIEVRKVTQEAGASFSSSRVASRSVKSCVSGTRPRGAGGGSVRPPRKTKLSQVRVLFAEDDILHRKQGIKFLQKVGISTNSMQIAESGREALNLLMNNTFDIVILDIKMPIIEGVSVIEVMMQYKKINRPKTIAMTGFSDKEGRDHYIGLGFDDCIPKPIDFKHFREIVLSLIDR